MKIERIGKDLSITVQNIRLTFKGHYHPPLLWIERYRPKKGDYEIILQLSADKELADVLKTIAKEIEETK